MTRTARQMMTRNAAANANASTKVGGFVKGTKARYSADERATMKALLARIDAAR